MSFSDFTMKLNPTQNLKLFKGIALFTPGGDLVYCIDPSKQARWHISLCVALQEMLGLSEPPHFLVPGYTATVDLWLDPHANQVKVMGEIYPPVYRYQALLNAVFGVEDLVWQVATWQEESCNPLILATYRHQFPELWEDHDLVVCVDKLGSREGMGQALDAEPTAIAPVEYPEAQGYVLHLFVSGHNTATERTLQSLYQLLEQCLTHPYTLKVIDIYKHPEQAEADQVSATPTLVKVWPRPIRKIVGDLENIDKVLQALGALEG